MPGRRPMDLGRELVEEFDRCGSITAYLVGSVPPGLWRAEPPVGRGRSIAAIVAHIQSVRRTFAKMGGVTQGLVPLDRKTSTRTEAVRALRASHAVLTRLFAEAIAEGLGRVKGQPRRTINMMTYLMQHEAHHRGQICTLARDLGHEFPGAVTMRVWGWKKLE